MKLYVGTSAFSVKEWKGSFYPERLADKEMLAFYSTRLCCVEINSTFRGVPPVARLQSWATQVPEGFRFTLKAPQAITHFKRLTGVAEVTDQFVTTARTLGDRLGALLFQLPPNFKKDLSRLEAFLQLLPADVPVAFEFRHPSWREEDSVDLLRSSGRALCVSDTDESLGQDESMGQIVKTANWGYLRLRRAEYSESEIKAWLRRIESEGWTEAYVFFKHEDTGTGPKLAQQFGELATMGSGK